MRIYLAEQFIARNYEVEFVLMRARGELISSIPNGTTLRNLKADRILGSFWPMVRYVRKHNPEVLLVAMWPLTVVTILAAKFAGYTGRIVTSDHVALSESPQASGPLRRLGLHATIAVAYRLADRLIAVSCGVADDLARISRIPRRRIKVIYNPAALGPRADADSPVADTPECKHLILAVGTLKQQKDHATLVKAFSILPLDHDAHLMILGEGTERKRLEELVIDLNLQGRVHLPGFVMNTRPYYEAADLFVLSSRWEGFGNVIVEALECGIPVISTDCPHGPAEILDNGKYGRLVEVGNPGKLAKAIDEYLSMQHDSETIKRRATAFHVSHISEQYLGVMFPDMGM